MARGRALFSEHRRRAASVPNDELIFPDTSTSSKLFNIRSHVAHDTDALLSASKRHDRDFLNSIQTKLTNPTLVSTFLKTSPTVNHNKARGPPPSRSAYYASTVAAAAVGNSAPNDLRRRTWYGPTSKRVDDYEVAAYLATPNRAPFISRALRAGSVPPVLPSRASAPKWYTGARGSSVPRWAPSSYRTYGSGRNYLQSHPDREDIVVGVAPTALYGDIVIGIPYRKQFMFDVQHGLDAVEDYPRIPLATRVTSPYFAYKSKPLWESPNEVVETTPYRRATYSGPRYTWRPSTYDYPSTHYIGHVSAVHAPPHSAGSRISTYGYPLRSSSARPASTRTVSEYDDDLPTSKAVHHPQETLSTLRLRAALAHDKANQHKTLLDKYLPLEPTWIAESNRSYEDTYSRRPASTGTHGVSIEHRATVPTVPKVPTHILSPSIGSTAASAAAAVTAASAASAASAGATTSKPFKPQISETRQKVRNLLCKSKKDPHYFD